MIKITIATSNLHKLDEINAINKNNNIIFDVVKGNFSPNETGKTFMENAIIKAKEAAKISKTYVLSDDSGLCVDALEGRPGIYSSRYAPTSKDRNLKLLNEMKGIPFDERSAHFECALVLVDKNGKILNTQTGKIFGYIDDKEKGNNGFGYDPIFYLTEYDKTIAELDEHIKNSISHRANALTPMLDWINSHLI